MKKTSTVRRLLKEMVGRYKLALVFVFIFIFISTFANVAGSFFVQRLVDDYIAPLLLQNNPVYSGLLKALFVMGAIYLTGVLATFAYNRMMVNISQGVQKKIRDGMFSHMQTLPIKYFDTHTHGNIMSHYTNDADTLREFFSMSLPQIISSIFTIITVTVAMLAISVYLSLIVLVFVTIMLIVSRRMGGAAVRRFVRLQKSVGELNGYIKEMINGQKIIKVFCHEQAAMEDFEAKNETLRDNASRANRLTNMVMPIVMNIGTAQYVAIALVGGLMALNGVGGVTLGAIAAFLTLSRNMSAPIGQISMQVNAITMALAGAARIFELMDQQPETDRGYVTLVRAVEKDGAYTETKEGQWMWKHPHGDGTLTYAPLQGRVEFYDVDFAYVEGKLVLKDVSLHAEQGQKIAFVGATGAGKTTITNLINRFYDIADGKIRYDGININKIKKADLRRSLGIVLQDTHLFSGTVGENIRYGNLEATQQDIEAAARLANAHDFIMRLPQGYETRLSGDGGNLSGGQRQLLSIARAAVANPPVMILDEATSSIDTRTEQIVQQGMDSLMSGRTVFVIAHRLSTIRNSEAIMVMENGEIIERGNHEQLLAQKGKYYQLYT